MLIDWLQCTFPDGNSLQQVKAILPLPEWIELPHGAMGYRKSVACGNVRILYDGRPGMGVHLILSGHGCREIEGHGVTDWQQFLLSLQVAGVNFTRIDVAIDDRTGGIDLQQVWNSIEQGHISTHCQTFDKHDSKSTRKERNGTTVYIGSAKSQVRIRMYDKAAEQDTPEADGSWVRVELQARDKSANILVKYFISQGAAVIPQMIAGVIEFKEPTEDSRRDRWPIAAWWAAFLEQASKLSIAAQPMKRTLESARAWLFRQVAPTIALLVKAADGNCGDLLELVDNGMERLQKRHLALLAT